MDPWTDGDTDPTEEFVQKMLALYGKNWQQEVMDGLTFQVVDDEPVELPPPDAEVIMVRKVFLRLPFELDQQFEQIGRRLGRGPSKLVTEWIAERLAGETEPPVTGE